MNVQLRPGHNMEHTGYLGNSRVIINNHYDAATQADIQHIAVSYESEDETSGRVQSRSRRSTALYSRQDILEQYCISERGMGALETDRRGFFSCLSSHQLSPCTKSSILTVCVQKVPSDENLQELYRRPQYQQYVRKPRWVPPAQTEIYNYEQDLNSSYFRRKAYTDASTYQWMPSDDESVRMERPRSILDHHGSHTTPHRTKHVSFARSHTLTSFDDAVVSLGASTSSLSKTARSQERLIDVRRSLEKITPITRQPELVEPLVVMEKHIRTPMKTQATQTEACLGRKPLPPSLSPRTVSRVKMVSQGAQTNGIVVNGRKLTKSYSEAGSKFGPVSPHQEVQETQEQHEILHRTYSDEPPRSPFVLKSPPPDILPPLLSDSSSITRSEHDSEESESKKEIFIDFKPQMPPPTAKKLLTKTSSDGEILLDQQRRIECVPSSVSHENILQADVEEQTKKYTPYLRTAPIRHEGIFKMEDHVFSSIDEENGNGYGPQDSIDEVFHENYIYDGKYLKVEGSSTSEEQERKSDENVEYEEEEEEDGDGDGEDDDEDECVVPTCYVRPEEKSASSDSLATDLRDHSDGIWNESQATVLQADSGTDNGTGLSGTSELTTSPVSVKLLTPSSRRKHLLMLQHQQRSSMDTDALDEELPEQIQITSPTSPRTITDTLSVSIKVPEATTSKHYLQLKKKTTISPIYKKRVLESTESPQPAVVPDLLARTDSGRTNTDLSESTTTDDYITANSTDSSRRSTSRGVERTVRTVQIQPPTEGDDMVVPSFSPPIAEETSELTPVPDVRTGRSSPTGSSSSSGSYSLNGSCPDLPQRPPVPSPKHAPSVSEDERSAHFSSSGYYDSPLEDDATWKSDPKDAWTEKERTKVQEMPKSLDEPSTSVDKTKPKKASPLKEHLRPTDKPKQRRVRTRSPMPPHRKLLLQQQQKKSPCHEDRPAGDERKPIALTSDESITTEQSPRKSKKIRDKGRKSPRSPTKSRKRSDSIEEKAVSLPGTLPRKKSVQRSNAQDDTTQSSAKSSRILSPRSHSPEASPTLQKSTPESGRLKALSAESLRSVSPGSDSVFYSDPSSHAAASDQHVHCLHCGKEVDIVTTDEVEKSCSQPDIVQPPEGFADSPRAKHPTSGRLFKKFEKRYRSEDRGHGDRRHFRNRSEGLRAKSEERGRTENGRKMRPMARSRDASLEGLRATDSSPSVLLAAPEDEDDLGVYSTPYLDNTWIYIDDLDELQTWFRSDSGEEEQLRRDSVSSTGSTESEHDFKKRYQAVTHRMVHRKSCLEMYKRQATKSFESDKTIVVRRESGEFGFRIHGSKPVVVSAIEPDTPAESSGLEVGDIVLAVNGISVLDKSHSEVVKIAHAGSDVLTLEVARTVGVLSPTTADIHGGAPLYSGYLWKMGGHASGTQTNKWVRRWFALKKDNCLYFYKTDIDKQPVGAMMLFNYEIHRVDDTDSEAPVRPFRFCLRRKGVPTLHLAADTDPALARWLEVLMHAADGSQITDAWLEQTRRDLTLPPNQVRRPDCFGYLIKLGTQWKSWSRRYCVLKDACLYFYQDANAKNAFGDHFQKKNAKELY